MQRIDPVGHPMSDEKLADMDECLPGRRMNIVGQHSSALGASLATRLAGPAIARWGCEGGARRSGEWGLLGHAELSHFHRNLSNATRREGRCLHFPISSFSAGPRGKDGQASSLEAWEDGGANSPRSLAQQQQGLQGVTDLGGKGLRWQMAREEEGFPFTKE